MDIVISGARVLTMDQQGTEHDEADIVVRNGRIEAIGPNAGARPEPDARIVDGRGKLAMPGLINGHFHSPMNLIKGALDDMPLELYMLYEVPPLADTPVSRDLAYLRTMLAALDLLKQGVTAIHDDVFCIPVPTEDEMDGVMEAYRDSGIRANVAINHGNLVEYEKLPFLEALIPPTVRQRMDATLPPDAEELLAINRHFIARWHGTADGRLRASAFRRKASRPSCRVTSTATARRASLPGQLPDGFASLSLPGSTGQPSIQSAFFLAMTCKIRRFQGILGHPVKPGDDNPGPAHATPAKNPL